MNAQPQKVQTFKAFDSVSSFKLDNNMNMKSTGQSEKHGIRVSREASRVTDYRAGKYHRNRNRSRHRRSLAFCFFPPTQSTSVFADYFIHDGFEVILLYS